ncbi:hypothetical protein N7G274_009608 [Stereocaulon virgatum]|uniref:Uncharacterized protein n=1 Tax=Stereocaulon virgatum TaxID=373712 RepID=A0ABR3ZWH1_9LECA
MFLDNEFFFHLLRPRESHKKSICKRRRTFVETRPHIVCSLPLLASSSLPPIHHAYIPVLKLVCKSSSSSILTTASLRYIHPVILFGTVSIPSSLKISHTLNSCVLKSQLPPL